MVIGRQCSLTGRTDSFLKKDLRNDIRHSNYENLTPSNYINICYYAMTSHETWDIVPIGGWVVYGDWGWPKLLSRWKCHLPVIGNTNVVMANLYCAHIFYHRKYLLVIKSTQWDKSDLRKTANCTNLVRGHFSSKWCQFWKVGTISIIH